MITIANYQKAHGLSYRQVRWRIDTGKINAIKKGRAWMIIEDKIDKSSQNIKPPTVPTTEMAATLKEQKLEMEIKRIQQQLKEKQRDIELRFMDKLKEELLKAIKPIPDAFRQCKLSSKQAKIIQAAFDTAVKGIKQIKG